VTSRTAALRYARALFDVALKEQQDLERVERELTDFSTVVKQHDELSRALLNPAIPAARKRAAVTEILRRATMTTVVAKLLTLLAERDRLIILPDIVDAFRQRVMDYRRVVRAEITTAMPLEAARTQAIERALAQATGRQVMLAATVDPAIIGGVVTRIGSTVYDSSVTGQLTRMKKKLSEARG
jgi:F-type H+-transporting ATPase subunit delta